MGDCSPSKEHHEENREKVSLDKIDPEVMKKYKALEKALIHEFIDDHVDLRDRYLKKSLELQRKVFGAEVEKTSSRKFQIVLPKGTKEELVGSKKNEPSQPPSREPPSVLPRTSTRMEIRRKSSTSRSNSVSSDFNDRHFERPESPTDQKSSSISVSFTDNSNYRDHRQDPKDRRRHRENKDLEDREDRYDHREAKESRPRTRSSQPSQKVKELSSDLFQTISEQQYRRSHRSDKRSPRSPRRRHVMTSSDDDTLTSRDSIAFTDRSQDEEDEEVPRGKREERRVKSASMGRIKQEGSARTRNYAERDRRDDRRMVPRESEFSLHEVDQRYRQQRSKPSMPHRTSQQNISTRSGFSSVRSRDLSPYRQSVGNAPPVPERSRHNTNEDSRHYSAWSRSNERSSPRRSNLEFHDRSLRQNSRPKSSTPFRMSHSSLPLTMKNNSSHSEKSPRGKHDVSKHYSLPKHASAPSSGGVSHRLEDTNEENISKWLELKEMEIAEDKWEKKARKLLEQKRRETEILSRAKREDDSKEAYDKWFRQKSRSIRTLEKKLSQTGIDSIQRAEEQNKNDECFKTWLRRKDGQKRKEREAERRRIEQANTEEVRTEAERKKAFNDWLKNKERSLRVQQKKKKIAQQEALVTELEENLSSRSKDPIERLTKPESSESKKISFLDEIVRKSDEQENKKTTEEINKTADDENTKDESTDKQQELKEELSDMESQSGTSVNSENENEH